MGSQSLQRTGQNEVVDLNQYPKRQDLRILEWRSNPAWYQFIPKVVFQYQQSQRRSTFLNQCKSNASQAVGVKFQKYIGNLSLLLGRLSFQQSICALRSLLSGHSIIYGFFGKSIIDPKFCFITKEGELRAWINSDYRVNSFYTQNQIVDATSNEAHNLFLSPQKWIDKVKPSSSPANLIQEILILVSQLCFQQNRFSHFVEKLENFISEDILKNYNFDRVSRFVNKYIYQKKLFIKSNLYEVVQRLYHQNVNQKLALNKSRVSQNYQRYREQRSPVQMSRITQNSQVTTKQNPPVMLSRCNSGQKALHKKHSNQDVSYLKNSANCPSTIYTKFGSTAQSHNFVSMKQSPIYRSICENRYSACLPYYQKQSYNKNNICPQFNLNCISISNKAQGSHSKMLPQNKTPKCLLTQNRSLFRNKSLQIESFQEDLNIISERKQLQSEELYQKVLQKSQDFPRTKARGCKIKQVRIAQTPENSQKEMSRGHPNMFSANKESNISIGFNLGNNSSLSPNKNAKLFRSNCVNNEAPNRDRNQFFTDSNHYKTQVQQKQQPSRFFTIKTITKLILSSQDISNQQQSLGDFPSNQNISSYSGILTTMGRSVEVIKVPQPQKLSYRTSKNTRTFFLASASSNCRSSLKSHEKIQSN